jgi:hypothetical protein
MTYENIFQAETVLSKACRHLSNRASRVIDGELRCDGAPAEAIDLMNEILLSLNKDRRALVRKESLRRKKRCAA